MSMKFVCDVCGKDTDNTKYVVPVYDRRTIHSKLDGKVPTADAEIKTGEVNLCKNHRLALAKFLSIIHD